MESVKLDRRIIRTQQAVKKAFLELFAEKDLEQITINEIADRANVNRGTVYLHFRDKYDLLDRCMEEHLVQLISFCKNRDVTAEHQSMVREPKPVFDYIRDHFPFFQAMFANPRAVLFRDRMLEFVSESLLAKLVKPDEKIAIEPVVKAQFMASAFVGIVEWWIRRQMPQPPQFMADQVKELFEKNQIYPA